jgi:hypothetical protein
MLGYQFDSVLEDGTRIFALAAAEHDPTEILASPVTEPFPKPATTDPAEIPKELVAAEAALAAVADKEERDKQDALFAAREAAIQQALDEIERGEEVFEQERKVLEDKEAELAAEEATRDKEAALALAKAQLEAARERENEVPLGLEWAALKVRFASWLDCGLFRFTVCSLLFFFLLDGGCRHTSRSKGCQINFRGRS